VPADVITLANGACGTGAILLSANYIAHQRSLDIWFCFFLLPLALILDYLDGYVARRSNRHSPLGADLDSLADIVSFGVAPAALGFALGMRGGWDALILIYFVTCGISRLARFNVTAAALADATGKVKYYEGTPIPTSIGIVLLLVISFASGRVGPLLPLGELEIGPWVLHPFVFFYALNGSAMISTFRVPKF
jgi:CDP-diacylglycerol--serine O-phosphatidyltransferase